MSKRRQSIIFFSGVLLAVLLITGLMRFYFHDTPPDRFANLYLAAVLVMAYRVSWKLAAALAGVSLLLFAYLLVPFTGPDQIELVSYSVCTIVIVCVTAALQRRRV